MACQRNCPSLATCIYGQAKQYDVFGMTNYCADYVEAELAVESSCLGEQHLRLPTAYCHPARELSKTCRLLYQGCLINSLGTRTIPR
jgi:hypothetical protein